MDETQKPKGMITNEDIVNRFGYHKADDKTGPAHQNVRGAFIEFSKYLNEQVPDGRSKSLAFTKLEEAAMWANKAVAEQAPIAYE